MAVPYAFQCLTKMNEKGASDLYLSYGFPPTLRIENHLEGIKKRQA